MKTMNGFTNELLVKKAKRNWRTRCGAFLLAVLASWYGGAPQEAAAQVAAGTAYLTTGDNWAANVVIDTVQTANRDGTGANIGAVYGYNIQNNGDKSVGWAIAQGHAYGVDLSDVASGYVQGYRYNTETDVRVGPPKTFYVSDAFTANGAAFTVSGNMNWTGGFNVSGGVFNTQLYTLSVTGNNTFANTSGFTINRGGQGYGGWLNLAGGGSNNGQITIGTGGLSITSNTFANNGTITISAAGQLELGAGTTLRGTLEGNYTPGHVSKRGDLMVDTSASFAGVWTGSVGVTSSGTFTGSPTGSTSLNATLTIRDVTNAAGLTNLYVYNLDGYSTNVILDDQGDVGTADIQLTNGFLSKYGLQRTLTLDNDIEIVGHGGVNAFRNISLRDTWSTDPDSYDYDAVSRVTLNGILHSRYEGDTFAVNQCLGVEDYRDDIGTVILTNNSNTFRGDFDIYAGTLEISDSKQLGEHGHNYDSFAITVGLGNLDGNTTLRSAFRVVGGTGQKQEIGHFFNVAGDNSFYEVFTTDAVNVATLPDANRFTVYQNGKLLGGYDLNKAGDGRLVLASVNNQGFTGNINVLHGIVSISHAANLGSGTTVAIGAQRASVADSHLFRPVFETTQTLGLDKIILINQENSVIRTTGSNNRTTLKGNITTDTLNGETYVAALNKEGAGTLVLAGQGQWYKGAGELIIKQGTVEFSEKKNLTTGDITIGADNFKDIELTEGNNPSGASIDYQATLALADNAVVSLNNNVILGSVKDAYIQVGTASVLTLGSITQNQAESDLNKTGEGKLVLDGMKNTFTGWSNIEKGTVVLNHEDSLVTSKGVDLIGAGATLDMTSPGANQTLKGLRGIDPIESNTLDKRDYHTDDWTRKILMGDNVLTVDLQNFKTTKEITDNRTEFQGHIISSGGMLVKEGLAGSTLAAGFTGFNGGFVINKGTIETLSDTTLNSLTGKAGTYLDVLDKTLTLDLGSSCAYYGTITSSTTHPWGSFGEGTLVKTGAGNLTAGFWDESDLALPKGFRGSLVLKDGNIYSTTAYHMEGGNNLTFYATPDGSGKVTPLILDVGHTADKSGTKQAYFGLGGETGTETSKVHVYMGDATTGWTTPKGSMTVGKIFGNETSIYEGLEASDTDSLFHSISLDKYHGTGRFDLHVNVNVTGFAGVGNTYNTISVGDNLDNIRVLNLSNNPGIAALLQDIWAAGSNLADPKTGLSSDAIKEERLQVIRGLFQQLSGDTIANAMYMGLDKPWQRPFDRLNLDSQMVYLTPPGYRGQSIANMRNLWFTPSVQSLSARSDGNARRFGIDRPGYQIGLDKRVAQNTSVGFVLGYSSPKLHQGDDRVEASDFQFGLYGGAMIGYYVEMKGYIGFGHQNYKSNRTVYLPNDAIVPDGNGGFRAIGGNQRTLTSHGRYDGDTFNFSFEVARPLFLGFAILRPKIGLDSEHAFRYGFTETGDATAMKFNRSSLSRTRARFGLGLETCTFDRAIFTGRLGYSCLLGGKDYATVNGQFVNISAPSQSIRSVAVGTSYFEAGVGTRIFMNPSKTLALVGNYDASIADHWAEHQAVVGFTYNY